MTAFVAAAAGTAVVAASLTAVVAVALVSGNGESGNDNCAGVVWQSHYLAGLIVDKDM